MLIPAIIKKNEILEAFKKYYYSDDMMYETGGLNNWMPNIQEETETGRFQFAIVNSEEKLIGYLDYHIDWYNSCASRFGLISFDRGNPIIGKDLFDELMKLIYGYKLHRIEWRMIGGNSVEKSYDKFCDKFNGTKHVLRDAVKDKYGKYHDDIIYEILTDAFSEKTSFKKENEVNKVHVGDVIQNNIDDTKATILDCDIYTSLGDERYWMVFTENGGVETWCEDEFTKTGKFVDVCNVLIK